MIPGVDPNRCRTPEILADATFIILNRDSRKHTGNLYIDEEVLAAACRRVFSTMVSPWRS
jgi:citronellol/citronellal dehydrogenase